MGRYLSPDCSTYLLSMFVLIRSRISEGPGNSPIEENQLRFNFILAFAKAELTAVEYFTTLALNKKRYSSFAYSGTKRSVNNGTFTVIKEHLQEISEIHCAA